MAFAICREDIVGFAAAPFLWGTTSLLVNAVCILYENFESTKITTVS